MNYKRSLIGVLVVACVWLAGCGASQSGVTEKQNKQEVKKNKDNHDEPVIIESGSVKMDLNFGDGAKAVGYLTDDGHYFLRGNAPKVKQIRVFTAADSQAEYKQEVCVGKPCTSNNVTEGALAIGVGKDSKEPSVLSFRWSPKDKAGLLMHSPLLVFEQVSGKDFQIVAETNSAKEKIYIDYISFKSDGIDYKIDRPKDGRIKVVLCLHEAPEVCE